MSNYNKFSKVIPNDVTEITVYRDGSVNIEVDDPNNNNFIEVDLTLAQLKMLVKEAEEHSALFTKVKK